MERAYVLINCDIGSEKALIEELKQLDNVKEAHTTMGSYDIIATVESKKPETLKETITDHIRKLEHIKSTVTLMGVDQLEGESQMSELIPDIIPEEKKPLQPPNMDDNHEEEFDDEEDDYDDEEDYSSQKKQRYDNVYKRRYRQN